MFRSSSTTRILSILAKVADPTGTSSNFLPPESAPVSRVQAPLDPHRRDRRVPDTSLPAIRDSVVAGDAVEWGLGSARRVLLTVALDAPAHRESPRRRFESDEDLQIVEQCRSGVGPDDAHALDGAVAGLARDGKAHVRRVREERELRHLEDAHPRDRLAAPREVVELGDLWIVLGADDLVAAHASLDRGKPRVLRAPRIGVAVLARDLERAGVDHVVEEDRLTRRARRRDQRLRHLGA